MTPTPFLFHSLLRPAVLQVLRATGFHSTRTAVLDSMTDLAARYLDHLCEMTALYAEHNMSGDMIPTIVDVRMALQHTGALLPEKLEGEQEFVGREDTRGTDEFIAWCAGPFNKELKRIALDGEEDAHDYLNALKKKHSKNEDDSKYVGTLLGKSNEHGDVQVEGGHYPSIFNWEERMRTAAQRVEDEAREKVNGDGAAGGDNSRPPSSGLSSLGDRSIADDMDLS
ncbi:hypothetical protein B0H66DRAFT_542915 [Apodospora peruviana]|uniref:Bromodomain associated domain-containing protein n=1 Tax=Apodospora peruviana TaxID=516989 RepID=A0AAE0ISE9_9PEZI|nr:hypothetical protein B0H66DRAFT_542915 [Apodospora peruviana]